MNKATHSNTGAERRRSKRRDILSTFSLFVMIPSKGPYRLPVHDISEDGMGFDFDIAEEAGILTAAAVPEDGKLEVHLYLNQSLYLPLSTSIRRVEEKDSVRRLGTEFVERQEPAYRSLVAFVAMLDAVSETGLIK